MPGSFKKSTLLNKFYDRVAGTLAGVEPCVRISEFRFGHGFVDESTTPPTFLPVDPELDTLPGVFHTGTPEMLKAEGRVLVRCKIPAGVLVEPQKFSLIGLYDSEGFLLAVMQDLPDWLTPADEHTAYAYLDFPHLGENPPTAF